MRKVEPALTVVHSDDKKGPPKVILARRGPREVSWVPAHFSESRDQWGTVRRRVRAGVYLTDTVTGQVVCLFEGAARPGRFQEKLADLAHWLGISQEDARHVRRGVSVLYDEEEADAPGGEDSDPDPAGGVAAG